MSDNRALLLDMVEKLFTSLTEKDVQSGLSDEQFTRHLQAIDGLGLTRLMLPEQAGGFDGNWEDAGPVFTALGRHGIPLPLGEVILANHWLHSFGQEIPEGLIRFAFASPGEGEAITVQRDTGFERAQWILALTPERWLLLPVGEAVWRGGRDKPSVTLKWNGQSVHASGSLPEGDRPLFAEAALMRSCQIAGAIEAMLRMTIDHGLERSQFGRPLVRFQAIQHQLAILAEESAAASCSAASACQAAVAGEAGFEIAAAKYRTSRAATVAADIAHQIHGAIGFTREYPLHHFSQPAQAWASEFGNAQHWAQWLGRFALDARPEPLWHWLTARSDRVLADEQGRRA